MPAASAVVGWNVYWTGPFGAPATLSEPATGGSILNADATVSGSTARANVTLKPESTETRPPIGSVGATVLVVASRVRKAARAGWASGWPVPANAPAWTDTE